MFGKPKYKEGDMVLFKYAIQGEELEKCGAVYIVDKYGVFGDTSDVSYDILVEEENMLYKHINEKFVTGKKEV